MTGFIKKVSIILFFAILLSMFASCNISETEDTKSEESSAAENSFTTAEITTETETTTENETATETQTTTEIETETETEFAEDVISFVDYTTNNSRGFVDLAKSGDYAVSFTVPSGQIKSMYFNVNDSNNETPCKYILNVYEFLDDYDSSVAVSPIFTENITSMRRTFTVEFDDRLLGEGHYLAVLSLDEDTQSDSVHTKIIQGQAWKNEPSSYEQYNIKSYINGEVVKKLAMCGGFIIEHSVVVTPPADKVLYNEPDPDNTAKVILIGGQSNATGATKLSFLQKNLGDEAYQKYVDGFDNTQIYYVNGTLNKGQVEKTNLCEEFVYTKAGQGFTTNHYGPELGLAAYLNEQYPDETFYIIKYAIGSSSLAGYWNPIDPSQSICLEEFTSTVHDALKVLEEKEGVDPRIIGFLWMQGEGDAGSPLSAYSYLNLQKALAAYIREEFSSYASNKGIAFIDAAISSAGLWGFAQLVNDFKYKMSTESAINYYIDTNKYGLDTMQENNDPAHYDSLSMIKLGELYGEVIKKIIK